MNRLFLFIHRHFVIERIAVTYWKYSCRKVACSIPVEVIFFLISLTFPDALGPEVYSASNRNVYQKHKDNNISGE
jgi:hypothetical protein